MKAKQSLNDLFVRVFNLINIIEEKKLKQEDISLSISEVHVLEAIQKADIPTMTQVASLLYITIGSLTTAIDGLVRKGYVQRVNDENDRRKVLVHLTPKALHVLQIHSKFHEDMIDSVIATFNVNDQKALVTALKQLENYFVSQMIVK